jgi:hypothetical protein
MLSTELRNRILAAGEDREDYEFKLRNIRVNSDVRGCSGFIKNNRTGRIVYVNTEVSPYRPLSGKVLYRTAESFTDYTGGQNRWGERDGDEFITGIVKLLQEG